MATYSRVRRQQLLQEAEGYLELVMVVSEKFSLQPSLRDRLLHRGLQTLESLDRLDSNHSHALHLRGQMLRLMERYEEALAPLRRAAERDSGNIHIYLALGWCYKRAGKLDEAIQALEDAVESDPTEAILHYNLACYWSLKKNVGLALSYLSQALEIDPHYRELVGDETDFDPVRYHPEFIALTSVVV